MHGDNILLLNFHADRRWCDALLHILRASTSLEAQLRELDIKEAAPEADNAALLDKALAADPNLILLILSGEQLEHARSLCRHAKVNLNRIPILVVSDGTNPNELFALFKDGISDFISLPIRPMDILPRVLRLLGAKKNRLSQTLKERIGLQQLLGENKGFVKEISKIPAVAKCDANALILGETGTGKEVCARAIHYLSPRCDQPFIPVNCAAIPHELVENELFGHERGAFTGASKRHFGLIHEANRGTLFLDEIDCLPLLSQVKVLRFLQEKEYRPLGSTKKCEADVRIIAATNVNLEKLVGEGKFRQDLYYRVNVIPLMLPPLRERKEDVVLLAHHFLSKYGVKFKKQTDDFSSDAIQKLMAYDWPGNVRELEHVIERAVVFSDQPIIRHTDILLPHRVDPVQPESFNEAKSRLIDQFERSYLQGLLLAHHGNVTKAAHAAKKNRRAFWELIRKHHLDVAIFRTPHKELEVDR